MSILNFFQTEFRFSDKDKLLIEDLARSHGAKGVKYDLTDTGCAGVFDSETMFLELKPQYPSREMALYCACHELMHAFCTKEGLYPVYHRQDDYTDLIKALPDAVIAAYCLAAEIYVDDLAQVLFQQINPCDITYRGYNWTVTDLKYIQLYHQGTIISDRDAKEVLFKYKNVFNEHTIPKFYDILPISDMSGRTKCFY